MSGPVSTPDLGPNASLHGKQVFAATSPWNTPIDKAPVAPNSANLIASIGLTTTLHPDFGGNWNGGPFGIPYVVGSGTQARVPVRFDYADESDPGPYPIPSNAPVENGSDSHVLVVDRDEWKLWELFAAAKTTTGWTSADAAGLPIFPGLVRYDEVVEQKAIKHALRSGALKKVAGSNFEVVQMGTVATR